MHSLDKHWHQKTPLSLALLPLSGLFCLAAFLRRHCYRAGLLRHRRLRVPVVIVGNITVGGTGKTPLVIWLAKFLRGAGFHPGIISRGYRGRAKHWPQEVQPSSDPDTVGDEPVVLARRCGCPVFVGPDRVRAGNALLEKHDCDVIISDDGLQHYSLERDVEIAVIDGIRRYGNGYCLPAGPLRESMKRLAEVDIRVVNGEPGPGEMGMHTIALRFHRLGTEEADRPADYFRGRRLHAVAGIGNPQRFFGKLRESGLDIVEHRFPDHYRYTQQDIEFLDSNDVIMTEKDAVKCERFAGPRHWFLAVEAHPDPHLGELIINLLRENRRG
jgi:tetraacyldisaccharide 4'-kinase